MARKKGLGDQGLFIIKDTAERLDEPEPVVEVDPEQAERERTARRRRIDRDVRPMPGTSNLLGSGVAGSVAAIDYLGNLKAGSVYDLVGSLMPVHLKKEKG